MTWKLLLFVTLLAAALPAEEASLSAEAILDKAVEASGGAKAHAGHRTAVMRITRRLAFDPSIVLSVAVEQKAPDLFHARFEARPGAGKAAVLLGEMGCDGKEPWAVNPHTEFGFLLPDEMQDFRLNGLDAWDWRRHFGSAVLKGRETIGKQEAYAVVLTPRDPLLSPVTAWIDAGSFRLLRRERTVGLRSCCAEPGDPPKTRKQLLLLGDWRSVDGVSLPFETRVYVEQAPAEAQVPQEIPGLTLQETDTVEELKFNVEVGDKAFRKPQD